LSDAETKTDPRESCPNQEDSRSLNFRFEVESAGEETKRKGTIENSNAARRMHGDGREIHLIVE
jgi:hypothetical protein